MALIKLTFNKNKDVDDFIREEFYKLRPSMYYDREEDFRDFLITDEEKKEFKYNFKEKFNLDKLPSLKALNDILRESGTSLRIVSNIKWIIDGYLQIWEVFVETEELGLINIRL